MQSVDQLRDRLAELMGWNRRAPGEPLGWEKPEPTEEWPDRVLYDDDPCPASLDWLAAHGLPEGWSWDRIGKTNDGWYARAAFVDERASSQGPTELHARLAACVAAWLAQAERTKP